MLIKLKKFYYNHKLITILASVLLFIFLFYIILNITVYVDINLPKNASNNSFYSNKTLVYAQKSKDELYDNTLMYYQNILENNNKYNVDGFEITVFLTKDKKIVVSSYTFLDGFTDCNEPPFNEEDVLISSKTIGELKQYNSAYNIKINGQYPYRKSDADLTYARIITLNELLNYLLAQNDIWKKSLKLIIKLGDYNKETIASLNKVITAYDYSSYCIIEAPSNKIAKELANYPDLKRTATYSETLSFFYNTAFNLKSPTIKYDLIYLDNWQYGIHFGKKRYTSFAHNNGVPIIYKDANTLSKIKSYTNLKPDGIAGSLHEDIYLASIK